jgi:hypothetical protein
MSTFALTGVSYLVLGTLLIGLGFSTLFMIGLERLSGSVAIARDGLARGSRAPVWRQPVHFSITLGTPPEAASL